MVSSPFGLLLDPAAQALGWLNAALEPVSLPIARVSGLTRLPIYFGSILVSYLGFNAIERVFSPLFFGWLFPVHYGMASKKVKQGWSNRACSMVHSVIVVFLASRAITKPEILMDKVHGTHPAEGIMEAFSAGYFIWDVLEESFFHYEAPSFALHGILVLFGITLTLRPLFPYTSVTFLFQELSTPFLNIHWFLDKTKRTGTTFQFINGIFLVSVFFLARICFGSLASFRFYGALFEARSTVPVYLFWAYLLGTLALQVMNWIWMYKLITAIRKRFPDDAKPGNSKTTVSKIKSN